MGTCDFKCFSTVILNTFLAQIALMGIDKMI